MHPDLQRYLDGEIPLEALSPELRVDAEAWRDVAAAARSLSDVKAPHFLEARVMASLPAAPATTGIRGALDWLVRPRTVTLRPATLGAAMVVIATSFALLAREPAGTTAIPAAAPSAEPAVYVQFVLSAPSAADVAVAGDFNGWSAGSHRLRDPDGDGVWTGMFSLAPGLHKYMFVVDGGEWVTDPRAERYVDDGFGMKNALIAVSAPVSRTS